MKQLFFKFVLLSIVAFFCFHTTSAGTCTDKKSDTDFISILANLKSGEKKEYVRQTLGEPYKIAFIQQTDNSLYEQMSYLVNIKAKDCHGGFPVPMIIEYNLIFKNGCLVGILENEILASTGRRQNDNHLTISMLINQH